MSTITLKLTGMVYTAGLCMVACHLHCASTFSRPVGRAPALGWVVVKQNWRVPTHLVSHVLQLLLLLLLQAVVQHALLR
jgi:hypothetical protein